MKLTVNLRAFGPQYFDVTTAMRRASSGKRNLPRTAAVGPMIGAFMGLISLAVLAALTKTVLGSVLTMQPNSDGDSVFRIVVVPFVSVNLLYRNERPADYSCTRSSSGQIL